MILSFFVRLMNLIWGKLIGFCVLIFMKVPFLLFFFFCCCCCVLYFLFCFLVILSVLFPCFCFFFFLFLFFFFRRILRFQFDRGYYWPISISRRSSSFRFHLCSFFFWILFSFFLFSLFLSDSLLLRRSWPRNLVCWRYRCQRLLLPP